MRFTGAGINRFLNTQRHLIPGFVPIPLGTCIFMERGIQE